MKSKYTDEEIKFILTLNDNEVHFIKELQSKLPDLRYIGGYTGSGSPVILQCKKCGDVFERIASLTRYPHFKKFRCINCKKIETQKRVFVNKINNYINKLIKDYNNEVKREYRSMYKSFKKNTIYYKKCKMCNNDMYTDDIRKTVCDKCKRKHKLSKHSNKSLRELYIRDKGICHICNRLCDYNDYVVKDKAIICGNNYPSIDHVIPLSKGGTDDWSNLKLAHRWCNSIKGNKTGKQGVS